MKIYGRKPEFMASDYDKALSKFTAELDTETLSKISKLVQTIYSILTENNSILPSSSFNSLEQ